MPDGPADSAETQRLLVKIRSGDREAFNDLFDRYRDNLREAVQLRLDPQLNARLDASDVVQEAQLEAFRRLDDFLERQPMPFGVWIRKTAHERLQKLRRAHLHTQQRTAYREQPLPDRSSMMIASQLLAPAPSRGRRIEKQEYERLVREAVSSLDDLDHEILLMRIVENMAHREIAQVLDLSDDAVRKRFGRALIKLQRELTKQGLSGSEP